MAFIYEFANSLYLIFMMCLTDFWGENIHRDAQGLGLLIIISTIIIINLLISLVSFIQWTKANMMKLFTKELDPINIDSQNKNLFEKSNTLDASQILQDIQKTKLNLITT